MTLANPLTPFLADGGTVVLDGALATELERRGADLRDPLWSAKVLLEQPALIRQVHLDYYRAGADVATSASYQATLPGLRQRGLSTAQACEVLRLSVRLACEAREEFRHEVSDNARPWPLVAASIGCYGAFLHDGSEYRGDYGLSVRQLMDWHRPRLDVFQDSGADLLACETIPCLAEAEALRRLLEERPGLPAWISFSCRDEGHLCHGELFADAVGTMNASDCIVAVGVNCTAPRFVAGLLRAAARRTEKPLLAYPNSGENWDAARHSWLPATGEPDWGMAARAWHDAGARLIGGCCRTTPATIRQIAAALPSPERERRGEPPRRSRSGL
jgi:homocysteine S-methyltransferase